MRGFFRLLVLCVFVAACTESAVAQQRLDAQITSLIEQIKKKASLKFDSAPAQSTIDTEAYELQHLSDAALVASVSEDGANALAAQQLAKAGTGFSNLRFVFSGQSVGATLEYKGSVSVPAAAPVDVSAQFHAQLTPAVELVTDHPTAEFRVRLAVTALDFTSLKLSRNGQPLPTIENALVDALVSGLLLPAQALLNRVEFRVPTIIAAKIDIRPTQEQGIAIDFDPKTVTPQLQIVAAAFLLDRGRLTIMAQDASPTNTVSSNPADVRFDAFRNDFIKALNKIGAAWVNRGQFAVFVETDVIQRLTSKMLATGPVCMQAKVVDLRVPVHDKLTLPPESSIDCTPTRDCTPTQDCSQTIDCAQRAACGEVCTLRLAGHCVTHGHNLGCEAGKAARKLACETDKAKRRGDCEAEKTLKKGACETLKQSEKDACEGLKQAYKSLRGTGPDYANIDSDDLQLNGGAKVCLNEIKLESKALHLTGKLQAEGAASASGNIRFTPLSVVGHLLCFAAFDFHLSDTVTVTPQPIDIDTNAQVQADANLIAINAAITNPIHIQFPFRAIAAKLAADPKFQILCPIPGVATNAGGVRLSGTLQRTELGIGGVFHVVNAGAIH